MGTRKVAERSRAENGKQIVIIITITITITIKPSNHQTITITITIMDHHHWTSSSFFVQDLLRDRSAQAQGPRGACCQGFLSEQSLGPGCPHTTKDNGRRKRRRARGQSVWSTASALAPRGVS